MRNPHPGSRWPRPHTSNMHRVISIHPEDEAQVPVLEVVPIAFVAGSFCSGANWNIFRMSRIFTDDKWLERIRLPGIPICHGHGHWRIFNKHCHGHSARVKLHLRPKNDSLAPRLTSPLQDHVTYQWFNWFNHLGFTFRGLGGWLWGPARP